MWNLFLVKMIYVLPGLKRKFNSLLSEKCGINHAQPLDSATSALFLILEKIRKTRHGSKNKDVERDEVIIPSFVCKAVVNAVLAAGCRPVLADIGEDFNISPASVARLISGRTLAVIAVHQYGKACRIDELKEICMKNNVALIEDSAIPIGVMYRKKLVGSWGDYAVFSFNMGKTVVSTGGGLLVDNTRRKPDFPEAAARLGRGRSRLFFFLTNIYWKKQLAPLYGLLRRAGAVRREENIGVLYERTNQRDVGIIPSIIPRRITRLQMAFTVYQLQRLEKVNASLKSAANTYLSGLGNLKDVALPDRAGNQFPLFPIRTKERYGLSVFLAGDGIETQWTFYPLHEQDKFREYASGKLPNTDRLWRMELSLPIYPGMRKKDAEYVCEKVREYYERGHKAKK
jgi:perosamine synthetase